MGRLAALGELDFAGPEVVEAWRCIGCGRIEAPRPCIGVCEDRRVRLVDAADHEIALASLREAERKFSALEAIVRRLALAQPRAGEWERSYRALQDQARRALAASPARPASTRDAEAENIEP
jgi:hypothetical protein